MLTRDADRPPVTQELLGPHSQPSVGAEGAQQRSGDVAGHHASDAGDQQVQSSGGSPRLGGGGGLGELLRGCRGG